MGTNYYIRQDMCKSCGRYIELHLGKSSGGWKFSFQLNGGSYYNNAKEMKVWLKGKQIYSEYGGKLTHKEFWEMVERKQEEKLSHAEKHSSPTEFVIDGYSFSDCEFS